MAAPITTMFSFPFSLSRSPKTLIAALQRNTDRAIDEEQRVRRRARWWGHRFYSSTVTDEGNEGAIPEAGRCPSPS